MNAVTSSNMQQFRHEVGLKFQLYNSLFTSLPFHRIEKTGILLSLFLNNCEEGFKKTQSPVKIIEDFFNSQTSFTKQEEKIDLLFRFVQYAERQVVLFDSLEDAAFSSLHDMSGSGTLKNLEALVQQSQNQGEISEKLKEFAVRLVLTAHPTQFYPGSVLGIINDLSKSIENNNVSQINSYLQQLGKTPFFNKQKPTPFDEAMSLIWYLENVFYFSAGRIATFFSKHFPELVSEENPVIKMGFWPGGDRDGNPFVNTETTLKVADALRGSIIKCYYQDVRKLKRRLTFPGVDVLLADLEQKLYNNIFIPDQKTDISKKEILDTLSKAKDILIHKHNSLFINLLENLENKVKVFGLYFASLDIRQDSTVHEKVLLDINEKIKILPENYETLAEQEKLAILNKLDTRIDPDVPDTELHKDTLRVMAAIKTIQQYNGPQGCSRYIISQCNSALNVIEVHSLLKISGWNEGELSVDIVPLFETIDDLKKAPEIMSSLYSIKCYRNHLSRRKDVQTIMLGFSDGTKDGGYLMANWSIFQAKEELTRVSKEYGIDVIFFDGRGGPPARGGGKTHKFYSSLGKNIANREIQLTIQGQTVSSNFGIIDSAQYNIEQLINAGISNDLFVNKSANMQPEQKALIDELATSGYDSYLHLKTHPHFLDYLSHASPLKFYAATNIGSRPAKRGGGAKLSLKDLRAIPFVGAWSQIKQNVTGYYGVGTALQKADKEGKFGAIKDLYEKSAFFKALIENCEMAMKKCFFPLTAFLSTHPVYGEIWNMIYQEYELTKKYIFLLSGQNELMSSYPIEQTSVQMRERIVLPLTTIQQYAITKVRELEEQLVQPPVKATYEKLAMRCSFGIINAGRNSA